MAALVSNTKRFHLKYPVKQQFMYEGILLSGEGTKASDLPPIREFEVRDDDIAIMCYLRTGSRWIVEMVSWICAGDDEEKVKSGLNFLKAPPLELCTPQGESHMDLLSRIPYSEQRMYSSHLQNRLAPKQLANKGKIICAVRNPKDNGVSLYRVYQITKMFGSYCGSWEEFLAGYMNGDLVWGSYFDWLLGWWPQRQNKNFLFLFYEDMKRCHAGTVKKIAEFLGKSLDENTIQKIVDMTSFSAMKNSPLINISRNEEVINMGIVESPKEGTEEYVRKGEVGNWKKYFTVKQSEEFDELVQQKLHNIDIKFEYEI